MSDTPSHGRTDDTTDQTTHGGREAADILIGLGWPVRPYVAERGMWQIRDAILTTEELVSFAIGAANPAADDPSVSPSNQAPRDVVTRLDDAEALECIRTVVSILPTRSNDAESAAAFRLIRIVLNKSSNLGSV